LHDPHYLRELNPEQRQAALATEGPVLVLAGAGSGKTRTLIYRIAHLLRGKRVDPRTILAVTFTNRAAKEMRERVARLVGRESKGVVLSTFHSLGARILREHGERIGMPKDFSIYPTGDQLATVKRVMMEEVQVAPTAGDDSWDAKRVLAQISDWKNRLVDPEGARAEVAGGRMRNNRSDDHAVLALDVYPRYEHSLRTAGACDFDDLLVLPVKLLREHEEARTALWRRWHYVMVDEYQDTNGAQLEMARLLAGQRKNLCVVGDDDQSIYAWRGADMRNILDFEHHFPGAAVVVMEENYRSTQRILDAANGVIAHNQSRRAKRLRTGNGPGPRVDYWELRDEGGKTAEELEAEMVAREIGVRRYHEKLAWADFAVLYRTNLQARPFEEVLRAGNIPYRVVGGTSFFDRKEVADAAAYLGLIVNPRNEMALRRIVNYPTRGIGRTTQDRLVAARAPGEPLLETMRRAHSVEGVSGAQAEALRHFVELIDELRTEFLATEAAIETGEMAGRCLRGFAEQLVKRVRLEEAVRADNAKSDRATEVRVDILRDFIASIGTYEARVWAAQPLPDEEDDWTPPSLRGFLERVSLTEEEKKEDADDGPDSVVLMTMHSAKGLEFTHVFIVGLEEEILPHSRSLEMISQAEGEDPIAEERRLFYVGITRARHRLTLSGCATRRRGGEPVPRQPSRFLKEIPPELLEYRSPGARSSLSEEESKDFRRGIFANLKEMLADGG
jgi:superfamily I DNA/RNA helicase